MGSPDRKGARRTGLRERAIPSLLAGVALLAVLAPLLLLPAGDRGGPPEPEPTAPEQCRLFGMVTADPEQTEEYSLDLSEFGRPSSWQGSGWSIAAYSDYYQGGLLAVPGEPMVVRSQVPVTEDRLIFESVRLLATRLEPGVLIAHLRNASSGCTEVADPHPFVGQARGRTFLLIHNGGVWGQDMEHIRQKLFFKPREPRSCPDQPIDSEYLFLNLLDRLEASPADDLEVIYDWASTIRRGLTIYWSAFNVLVTDGRTIWAVRSVRRNGGYPLHYRSTPGFRCHVISTEALESARWRPLPNDTFAVFEAGAPPLLAPLIPESEQEAVEP
jgi:predicted glutamine amidotransferase